METLLGAVSAAAAAGAAPASPSPPAAAMTVERMRAEHPAIAAALLAEGATFERDRVLGIQAAAFVGQEALAAELVADGKTTPEAAALKFNAALKAKGPNHVAALSAMDPQARVPANLSPQGGAGGGEKKTYSADKAGWMAEWKDTPALQADYLTAEDYAAARSLEGAGRVKTVPPRAAA